MERYKVVEKENRLAVHCLAYSRERAQAWIDQYGDSKMFMDKTLNKDSFEIVERGGA
jgi:hypothetical protein